MNSVPDYIIPDQEEATVITFDPKENQPLRQGMVLDYWVVQEQESGVTYSLIHYRATYYEFMKWDSSPFSKTTKVGRDFEREWAIEREDREFAGDTHWTAAGRSSTTNLTSLLSRGNTFYDKLEAELYCIQKLHESLEFHRQREWEILKALVELEHG